MTFLSSITFIIIVTVVWGGLIISLTIAIKKEKTQKEFERV